MVVVELGISCTADDVPDRWGVWTALELGITQGCIEDTPCWSDHVAGLSGFFAVQLFFTMMVFS